VRRERACIESDGQRASVLEEREMRGAANADLAALDGGQLTRGAGFDADINCRCAGRFSPALGHFKLIGPVTEMASPSITR